MSSVSRIPLRLLGRGALVSAVVVTSVAAMRGGPKVFYVRHNLVSDGFDPADFVDPELVNPWGIVPNPTGFWWVNDNATGVSTLYDGDGHASTLVVSVPSNGGAGTQGRPTGIVFNPTSDFVVTDGTNSGPAAFLFCGEDGVISGWAPGVPPPAPSTQAQVAVDSSADEAIYKGLALASTRRGNFLFAADFHNARIDEFDGQFQPIDTTARFEDPSLPSGFAPFNVAYLREKLYVAYAMQDAAGEDEVEGPGLGYVDVYALDGHLVRRLVSGEPLDAPWGLAIAPHDFTGFGDQLLVGNFGDGTINVFDPVNGRSRGKLEDAHGNPLVIDGLWGLAFGNGGSAGPKNVLFFSAGSDDEAHGLFGRIEAVPAH